MPFFCNFDDYSLCCYWLGCSKLVYYVRKIARELAHHITTLLFFGFGLWTLWEAYNEDDDDNEELEQVEKELNQDAAPKDTTGKGPKGKEGSKADEDVKKQTKPFLTNFFSPVFIKAFSVTFFGEWGDKSQIATIGLAADENAIGVILGGILAQVLCTVAAVAGGKSLASKISERLVTMASGVLFLIFGVQSFLSTVY